MIKLRSESLSSVVARRRSSRLSTRLALTLMAFGSLAAGVKADTYNFTNGSGDNEYLTGANWTDTTTGTTGTVPNLNNSANTALINDGVTVDYHAGGDLLISSGGTLDVRSGGFIQSGGNNWIQLQGNGSVIVDGGTFNQGTDSRNPFNVSGTGNVFNVTNGGTAVLTNGFQVYSGLSSTIDSSTANVTGGQVTVNSSLTVSGSSTVTSSGGLEVTSGGTLTLSNGTFSNTTGNATVDAGGTLNMSGGTLSTAAAQQYSILGTATHSGGTVTTGSVNVGAAGSLTISGGTVNSGGRVAISGTFSMSAGALTLASSEFDYNSANNTLSGGTITTPLITGVNGTATSKEFNISGGTLALSGTAYNGIYSGGSAGSGIINFTANSSGYIDFTNGASVATIQGFISSNKIEYNNTAYNAATGYSLFTFGMDANGNNTLTDFFNPGGVAVPEPATWLAGGLLTLCVVPVARRRFIRQAA